MSYDYDALEREIEARWGKWTPATTPEEIRKLESLGITKTTGRAGACCDLALAFPCVCRAAYECPAHGITHIGTHD